VKNISGHTSRVCSVSYSPGGSHIVSGSDDKTVRIWDARTGACLGEPLRGHSSNVNFVAYSSDGSHIVSGSDDKTACIWDARTIDSLDVTDSQLLELRKSSSEEQRIVPEDGWIRNDSNGLLLWVPSAYRFGFFDRSLVCIRQNTERINVVLDDSRFCHGDNWPRIASAICASFK